jgi:hypothetical protein
MDKESVIDLDSHMRILNFLIYLQSIGILSENERINYSNYIQEYLKERKENLDFLNQLFSLLSNSN